jgi:hypothetical protein
VTRAARALAAAWLLAGCAIPVTLPPDADPPERARRIDEAILVDAGGGQASADPVLTAHLVRALRAADPAGFADQPDRAVLAEALRLDLAFHDPFGRQRLAELGRLALSRVEAPPEAALEAWRELRAEVFTRPARLTIAEVFFADPGPAASAALEQALRADPSPEQAARLGDPRLDRRARRVTTVDALRADFGDAAADALSADATGAWLGPFDSPRGAHLLRVLARAPAALPPLDDIREAVSADLTDALARQRLAEALQERRGRVAVTP